MATLVRRVVAPAHHRELGLGIGAAKRAMLAGQFPELVKTHIDPIVADQEAKRKRCVVGQQVAAELSLPAGYAIESDGDDLIIKGNFDHDLHTRLKRAGAKWDGLDGNNTRTWIIPLENTASLKRVFNNWVKASQKKIADEEKSRIAREQRDIEEQRRRAAESAERNSRRAAESTERERQHQRAVAARIKVVSSKYKIGDEINGRQITGFGKQWTESQADPDFGAHGQRWDEECEVCGHVGVVDNRSGMCKRHHGTSTVVAVCYAYTA